MGQGQTVTMALGTPVPPAPWRCVCLCHMCRWVCLPVGLRFYLQLTWGLQATHWVKAVPELTQASLSDAPSLLGGLENALNYLTSVVIPQKLASGGLLRAQMILLPPKEYLKSV